VIFIERNSRSPIKKLSGDQLSVIFHFSSRWWYYNCSSVKAAILITFITQICPLICPRSKSTCFLYNFMLVTTSLLFSFNGAGVSSRVMCVEVRQPEGLLLSYLKVSLRRKQ
jgi:hypothetical protein